MDVYRVRINHEILSMNVCREFLRISSLKKERLIAFGKVQPKFGDFYIIPACRQWLY
jgi:hypothetical protein